nr:hypothetical protein [Tanacetum cinerariifolium]
MPGFNSILRAFFSLGHDLEEDAEEEEEDPEEEDLEEDPKEDPEEDPEGDDDDVMEMDDEAEVIDPYMDDGSNNPPPPNSEDEETPPTSPVIHDADEEDAEEEEEDPEEEDLEEDPKEDPEEDPEGDDDDVMEMDDEAEVIDPYMDDGSNKPPPPNSEDEEIPPTSPVIHDADGQSISPIASFSQNFHFGESSSTANLLTGYSKIVPTGPMCLNLGTAWKRLGKMEKPMSERIDTEGIMKKKFKEQDHHFVGLGCENKEMDNSSYTTRFNELVILCLGMVPTERKKKEKRIIRRGSKRTSKEAVVVEVEIAIVTETTTTTPTTGNVRAMTNVGNQNTNESGQNLKCNRCGMQHYGNCPIKCIKCGKIRHKAIDSWSEMVATSANAQPIVTCYGCEEKGHIKTNCLARNNPRRSGASGQAYALRDGDQNLGPNVVTGTFLLNNRYARVLFDSGSDKSFVNVNFSHLIDIELVKVDHSYEVELADGRVVSTNTFLRGCALNLVNHLFEIDIMPIELGTFNVIIRMDWLILQDAIIVYGKKEVHVPLKKKTLVVKGDDCVSRLKVVSCMKVKKYVDRGSYLFVAKSLRRNQQRDVWKTCLLFVSSWMCFLRTCQDFHRLDEWSLN